MKKKNKCQNKTNLDVNIIDAGVKRDAQTVKSFSHVGCAMMKSNIMGSGTLKKLTS